jgi:hypothetical protein
MFFRQLIVSSLLLVSAYVQADTLAPFTSDGCSAFPDGTIDQKNLWLKCCQRHDFDYWQGGTYQQRIVSDQQLKQCVADVGEPTIAVLMLAGVRVGGTPYLPTSFRWGYGWSYPKLYGALSVEELVQVAKLSTHLNFKSNTKNR